ncbi:MAG TPA: hypothetical protein DCZ94_08140 [Lentisphaeria bacterium]|nr:MAG: hypothetical protein A2X48_19615 [Lentisphaerae bacterium GWF2_49_21]HBC86908.1 hypothetical protein [Lentisphaeria bacterium]
MEQKYRNRLKSGRAAILLETGLVMPIYLVLLCICIDIPRVLIIKQRLDGAQRLVSEIRARNQGTLTVDSSFLEKAFFDDGAGKGVKLTINPASDKRSLIGGAIQSVQDWVEKYLGPLFPAILKFIANLVTGGNLQPYFFNVFDKDVFYSGSVKASAPTMLPSAAYTAFAGGNPPPSEFGTGYYCYMPGCDTCKYTGESFIGKMIDWLNKVFG